MDLLIVNLDETATDEVCLRSVVLCDGDYLGKGAGDDSTRLLGFVATHHCVGFAAAGLPVSEDCAIVAVQNAVD